MRVLSCACLALALPAAFAHAHPGNGAALHVLDQLIAQQPAQQALHIERGAIYSEQGEIVRALADFRRAEQLGDPQAVAFDLGLLHYRTREFALARGAFDRYLLTHPQHAETLLYRARCWQFEGKRAQALMDYRAHFDAAVQPNPGDYLAAARMIGEGEGADSGKAVALLDAGMRKLGVLPLLQDYAVQLELRRGDSAAALQRWRALQAMLGGSPEWQLRLAQLLIRDGQPDQALVMLREAQLQLAGLRATPARMRLRQQIADLSRESRT